MHKLAKGCNIIRFMHRTFSFLRFAGKVCANEYPVGRGNNRERERAVKGSEDIDNILGHINLWNGASNAATAQLQSMVAFTKHLSLGAKFERWGNLTIANCCTHKCDASRQIEILSKLCALPQSAVLLPSNSGGYLVHPRHPIQREKTAV